MTRLNVPNVKLRHGMVWNLEFHNSSHEYHELRPHHIFHSPNLNLAAIWGWFPYKNHGFQGSVAGLARDQIYPDPMGKNEKKPGNFPSKPMAKPPGTTKASLRTAAASSSTATAPVRDRRVAMAGRWSAGGFGAEIWRKFKVKHGETWWNHRKSAGFTHGNPWKTYSFPEVFPMTSEGFWLQVYSNVPINRSDEKRGNQMMVKLVLDYRLNAYHGWTNITN